ncbi:hypothetical protein [Nostoc sp. T09]|uniref:hypothetical protein n=1 Tax=Nostoc sp. T09 TaxID=1932621 RepID=UPI0011800C18|nr:hypothetical protein [Nostoc sp. T09]
MSEIQTVQTNRDLNGGEFLSLPPLYCHQRQAKPCITRGQRWRSLRPCPPVLPSLQADLQIPDVLSDGGAIALMLNCP